MKVFIIIAFGLMLMQSTAFTGDPHSGNGYPVYSPSRPTLPLLKVTSPNGGEKLKADAVHKIKWTCKGTKGNVKIKYSIDNGSTWTTIDSSTVNDGAYSWRVPGTVSSQCLVKIYEVDGSPSDTSDSSFAIARGTGNR